MNDGGPAFPIDDFAKNQHLGISIRDWFAGQALNGAIAGALKVQFVQGMEVQEALAFACYIYADAMIAERAKEKP